jgi:RNA polymerase sigma-70 factor (ECF subfamily)
MPEQKDEEESTDIQARFQEIVSLKRRALIAALSPLLDVDQAEDAAQEAALRVYQILDRLEAHYLEAYWFRTARNLALSKLRQDKTRVDVQPLLVLNAQMQSPDNDGHNQYHLQSERELMVQAINALPPACRNVFIARKIEGKTQREIADELAISINTVQNHLTQGMKLIRRFIATQQSGVQPQGNAPASGQQATGSGRPW